MTRWAINGDRWNGGLTRVTLLLLVVTVAVYFVQHVLDQATSGLFSDVFALSTIGVMRGMLWQAVTYIFLHGGVLHILLNMLTLYFIGPELERTMGRVHFLVLYLLSGVLGGLGWLAMEWGTAARCVGASGAIFGILGAFAGLFPNRPMTLLVFFVIPVTMRAWVVVAILSLIQLALMVTSPHGGIAYVAHLGGALAGYVYAKAAFRTTPWGDVVSERSPSDLLAGARTAWQERRAESDQKETDRLLDKIAREGLHSLTAAERKFLEKASERMRK